MRAFLLLCLLPLTLFAANLQDLVSASNDFEVEIIDDEHVLERNPFATDYAPLPFAGFIPLCVP
jgi:hypothetical protein